VLIKEISMKVRTDLRSGNMLDDAAQEANKALNQVTGFVSEASAEAEKLTNSVINAGKCVYGSF